MEYYEIFNLKPTLNLSTEELKKSYQALQKQYHPDRFIHASAETQQKALINSSLINDAYKVLENPVKRAQYLIECHHIKTSNQMSPTFLMQQMELEEKLEASLTKILDLKKMLEEVNTAYASRYTELENKFSNHELQSISELMNEIIFLDKFRYKIKDTIQKIS
ncbi:MAG: Fe-S protein assembly co-chaperone HscB [Nitrosomonadales bacterium]